jgi:hypothetical protein
VLAPRLPPPGGELSRVDTPFGGAHQQLAQLGTESPGAQRRSEVLRPADGALLLRVAAEQLGDDGILLGRGQQPRRQLPAEQGGPTEDAVGVGVEGAGQRLTDRPRDTAGDPGAQLGSGLSAEGQDQDLLGVDPGVDPGGDRLDDRRGLARAGAGEHEERAAGMVHDCLLGGVEQRERRGHGAGRHQPVDRTVLPAPLCHPTMEAWRTDRSVTASRRRTGRLGRP